MARVQLVIPDEDRDQFVHQAKQSGHTLSAWLRKAAHEKLTRDNESKHFGSVQEVRAFYQLCDDAEDQGREPGWQEHLDVINRSQDSGTSTT